MHDKTGVTCVLYENIGQINSQINYIDQCMTKQVLHVYCMRTLARLTPK